MYRINQIRENMWLIGEDIRPDFTNTMALVVGKKKAVLIDSGCGIGNLKDLIHTYTQLPVTVLTTHVHLDHVGGHGMFQDIYAPEVEMKNWVKAGLFESSVQDRLDFLKAALERNVEKYTAIEKSMWRNPYFSWKSLHDGMSFDLGGTVLTACMVPGHTRESYVFADRKQGAAFVGDSINPTPWILMREESTVENYGRSVERFRKLFPEVKHLYSGHCMDDIGIQTVEDTLNCVREVLRGCDDPEITCYAGKALEHRTGSVTMLYRKECIR